ncbi:MAG: hypothetical protein HZA22_04690 [Nitrospirae bacterium]|nr:hypothetical protein [Nitrospirota bacterium]
MYMFMFGNRPFREVAITSFVLAVLMFSAITGYAADAAPVAAQSGPLGEFVAALLVQVVFPFVAAALAILVPWVLLKLKKKLNIEIGQKTEAAITDQAFKAVHFVEEWAALSVKKGIPVTSGQKYEKALGMVREALPTLTPADAERYIQSAIGLTKGLGASKEVGG